MSSAESSALSEVLKHRQLWEQYALPRSDIACFCQCGHHRLRRRIPQFLRLQLVQPAAVDSAFADERLGGNLVERSPHGLVQFRFSLEKSSQARLGVEHQIDVRCRRRG